MWFSEIANGFITIFYQVQTGISANSFVTIFHELQNCHIISANILLNGTEKPARKTSRAYLWSHIFEMKIPGLGSSPNPFHFEIKPTSAIRAMFIQFIVLYLVQFEVFNRIIGFWYFSHIVYRSSTVRWNVEIFLYFSNRKLQ